MRPLLMLLALIWPLAGLAQDTPPEPRVTAELSAESVTVGQAVVLRITVLVPTWMPTPPTFPSFEAPNLIVRLPQNASGPVSQSIEGETWSGVSRAYRLYPMVEGTFTLPPQVVDLVFADPPSTDPVAASVSLPPVSFAATVPEAARDLDPLIVAGSLTLEQTYEGGAETLEVGAAVTREVTAKVDGTSPLFIPPLIAPVEAEAVQAYPKDPALKETDNRGTLSGQRMDSVTYVARYGGGVSLPEIRLEWFNSTTGKVETVSVPGMDFTVGGPAPPRDPVLTPRQMVLVVVGLLFLVLIGWAAKRYLAPPLLDALERRRQRRLASEAHAAKLLRSAIGKHDLPLVAQRRQIWDARVSPVDDPAEAVFSRSLLKVGEARYGSSPQAEASAWAEVAASFETIRKARLAAARHQPSDKALAPLNPF
ncbi:BatD family protein [Ruegeria sediminis]|nr:BatD family protein [Ruegeria sediminis]